MFLVVNAGRCLMSCSENQILDSQSVRWFFWFIDLNYKIKAYGDMASKKDIKMAPFYFAP